MKVITYLSGILFLSFFIGCSTTKQFAGPIEPIKSPTLVQYSPYVASEVSVVEISFDIPGTAPSKQTVKNTCDVFVTTQHADLHLTKSCREVSDGSDTNSYQITASMSLLGKYSDVAFSKLQTTETDKDDMDKIIKSIAESEIFVIRNPIFTGSSIFKAKLSDFLKLPDLKISNDSTIDEIVRGWSTHEGRRVLVTECNIRESFLIPKLGLTKINGTGYRLIDSKTMAPLSSQGELFFEFSVHGKTGNMIMNYSSAALLK